MPKITYYKRLISAYLIRKDSHLSFWHGEPEVNENASFQELGEYYMLFLYKAAYPGPFDNQGIPLLDYKGKIGKQYNPIAISQYGLGHYNLYKRTKDSEHLNIFLNQANWLVENLEMNSKGLYVWNHHFDWEYRETLKAPWYSALSQGQGISLLTRAYQETQQKEYIDTTEKAFESFEYDISKGGVRFSDKNGNVWLEETIVEPPTHILNGFIWALWGVYDYYLVTTEKKAEDLIKKSIETLKQNLEHYDIGFWSLYELSGTKIKMLASFFYHKLHIAQLKVMYKLTDENIFNVYENRWNKYENKKLNRFLALFHKSLFKLIHY